MDVALPASQPCCLCIAGLKWEPWRFFLVWVSLGSFFHFQGRRSREHKFLPGVFVPPGGKVDEADYKAEIGLWFGRCDCLSTQNLRLAMLYEIVLHQASQGATRS